MFHKQSSPSSYPTGPSTFASIGSLSTSQVHTTTLRLWVLSCPQSRKGTQMESQKRPEQPGVGPLVDWLGSRALSSDENGTPSENQPFPRHVYAIPQKFACKKPHEDAQEVPRRVQLLSVDLDSTWRLSVIQGLFWFKTKRKSKDLHRQAWMHVARKGHILN